MVDIAKLLDIDKNPGEITDNVLLNLDASNSPYPNKYLDPGDQLRDNLTNLTRLLKTDYDFPDPNLQKLLFTSKRQPNITSLFQCLSTQDTQAKKLVIQVLLMFTSNFAFMAKNGLSLILCTSFKTILEENHQDSIQILYLTLLIKLSEYGMNSLN